ncbi:MAG: hypothetical protein FJ134_14900 [Deltaproteobacteria bacterium]|nr:hypothetical protein [Deltaproteobacteria bacterium]
MARFRDWQPFISGVHQMLALQRGAARPEAARRLMLRPRSGGMHIMPRKNGLWHFLLAPWGRSG